MDTRRRGSTSRNKEIRGNTANAHDTSTRRDSNDVSHSLDKEHKCCFVRKKGRKAGSGARLMLIDPKGKEYTYALRFRFETMNNEAEYEALLAGL
ncbi:hypothetical protein Tco_0884747 [Tanacetum coccineum]